MGRNKKSVRNHRAHLGGERNHSATWIFTSPVEFYLASALFLLGAFLCWHTETHYTSHDPRKDYWTPVAGRISEQRIEKRPCFGRKDILARPYSATFTVPYSVGGIQYMAQWGPYCAWSEESAASMISSALHEDGTVMVYVNPVDPSQSVIHLDGPWQLWLGRVLYLILLVLGIPKAVLVPTLNLRCYLRGEDRTKSLYSALSFPFATTPPCPALFFAH